MAKTDRFMIAPIQGGTQTDMRPWLIPDDAFEYMHNAYIFRGRVKKRFGSHYLNQQVSSNIAQLSSRLRVLLQNYGATPTTGTVPGAKFEVGQIFSVGNVILTVTTLGTPAAMISTDGTVTGTYNTSNGNYSISGGISIAGLPIYFYPSTPVCGFITYEDDLLNKEPVYAFDTQFAYNYVNGAWTRLASEATTGAATWSGNSNQLFWGYSYSGETNADYFLYVTNFFDQTGSFSNAEMMRYWNGNKNEWNFFNPQIDIFGSRIVTAKIIVPFQDRLLLLNTVESQPTQIDTTDGSGNASGIVPGSSGSIGQIFSIGTVAFTITLANGALTPSSGSGTGTFNTATGAYTFTGAEINEPIYWTGVMTNYQYVDRCRFSGISDSLGTNAYRDDIPGNGNFADAGIREQIITAQFIKNRLIVYFESSTWELAFVNNQIRPFLWQQLNTELGAESTFSEIPFDAMVLGIGSTGIHACNGSNVQRIDQKIPDQVWEISDNSVSVYRIYGIRDYFSQLVYWTFPSEDSNKTFTDRILVYNYLTSSWAMFFDTITAFGYAQRLTTTTAPTLRQVIAGNQQGYTYLVDTELGRNAPSLQITNLTYIGTTITITSINHNLSIDDFILIENCLGVTSLNDLIFKVTAITSNTLTIISSVTPTGIYTGQGTITRVSRIDMGTKQYNFYVDKGCNALINKVDFLVDKTDNGQVTIDWFTSTSPTSPLTSIPIPSSFIGNGILTTAPYPVNLAPLEQTQTRLWHPMYPMADGECIQLRIYLSDTQILSNAIALSKFEMHAMTFFTQISSSRLQ